MSEHKCCYTFWKPEALPGKVTTIGNLPDGSWNWHGGVVGVDGAIYGIPAHAESVLKVVPATGEVKTIGPAIAS